MSTTGSGTQLAPLPVPAEDTAKSTDWRSLVLGMVVGGAVAALAAFALARFDGGMSVTDGWGFSKLERVLFAGALIILVPLVILAHECGHLLGGKLVGFRFRLLIAGPLKVTRENDRIRVGLNRSLALAGGIASSMPTDSHDLRRRVGWMVAGGPLTNAVFGVMLIGAWALVREPVLPATHTVLDLYLQFALLLLGVASLGIAVVTLIPARTGGFHSDGARLLMLLKGGPVAERESAVWHIVSASTAGVRPRDWPEPSVTAATALADGSGFESVARSLAYSFAMDRQEVATAGRHLARALELWTEVAPAVRANLALEAAWLEGAFRGDAPRARGWLDRAGESPFLDEPTRVRAKVAVLLAEGRREEALEVAGDMAGALDGNPDPGGAAAQREWLDRLLA